MPVRMNSIASWDLFSLKSVATLRENLNKLTVIGILEIKQPGKGSVIFLMSLISIGSASA